MKKRVIILGAGPAGLTAGYELLNKDKSLEVIILEQDSVVGGISKTKQFNGNLFDLGGHRYFTQNKRVKEWWGNFLCFSEIDNDATSNDKNIMLKKTRKSSILFNESYIDYPIQFNKNTIAILGFSDSIKVVISYIMTTLFSRKDDSLESFYEKNFGRKLYMLFFKDYTEKLWGKKAKDISSDWGRQRVQNFSIKSVLKSFFSYENSVKDRTTTSFFYYPKLGSGQLWENVADKFIEMGGKIIFDTKVAKVIRKGNKIHSVLCENSCQYDGEVFISSIPLKDLLQNINNIPSKIYMLSKKLPYREFVIVILLIKKDGFSIGTFDRNGSIIKDNWIYIQNKQYKMGRIQIFDNWSESLNKNKDTIMLGIEFFCQKNDSFWNMTTQEWKNLAIKELIKCKILSDKSYVFDGCVEKVEKAYPAYWDGYYNLDEIIKYINTFDNLFCIGRNGQHRYNNIDHSMETAFVLVDYLYGKISDKSAIWKVNSRQDYCEENMKKQE